MTHNQISQRVLVRSRLQGFLSDDCHIIAFHIDYHQPRCRMREVLNIEGETTNVGKKVSVENEDTIGRL